ncbi:uncharacterized protein METZ01_LOCUS239751, partial [marine metagenome]
IKGEILASAKYVFIINLFAHNK